MKKYFRFILAAMAMTAMASCAEELEDPTKEPVDVELVPMTITVGSDTKTHFAEDGKTVNWCETDEIAVFDKVGEKRLFTIKEGSVDGKQAIFEGQVAAGTTDYCAVYPYSAAVSCSGGKVVATTPLEQTISGKNVADGAIVAVGKSKVGQPLQFRNVVGVFKFEVTYTDVTEIYLEGNAIAGQAQFDAATGEIESGTLENASAMVTLKPSGEKFATGTYYIPLLPGTTEAGKFMITMAREGDMGAVYTIPKAVTVPRNDGFIVADTKLTETFLIKDAVTLQTFLTEAKDYEAGQHATIVKDIDLTGETLTPAETFLGTLDGRNHSLKNWINEGLWLFKTCNGTIANLKIDASCKVTPKMGVDYGIFAGVLNPTGQILSCENNADMTLDVAAHTGSRFGCFVGKNDGYIKDCINNGAINIKTQSRSGNVYIGGFAGNSNPRNGVPKGETPSFDNSLGFENCINNGDITYYCNSTGGYVFVGGISNSTTAALVKSEGVVDESGEPVLDSNGKQKTQNVNVDPSDIGPYCCLKNCENTGDITVTITNGGSMEENAGTKGEGNYSNVGGCVGFLLGELQNCDNKGNITFNVPTSETVPCMSRPAVGGVAGFVWKKLTDCDNLEGKVYVKGTFASGGLTNPGAGCEAGASFGGVVGQVGPMADDAACKVSNCHNYAEMEIYSWMAKGNGSYSFTGGVVGYAKAAMVNCSNNGKMTVEGKVAGFYAGGVVASCTRGGSSLTNNGDLTFKPRRTAGGSQLNSDVRLGGIAGGHSVDLSNCTNNKSLTVTTESIDDSTVQMKVGGVLGRGSGTFENNNNNGSVVVNYSRGSNGLTLAGVASWLDGGKGVKSGKNTGSVTYNSDNSTGVVYMGGYAGYISGAGAISGLTNDAPVTFNAKGAGETRVAGVIGQVPGATSVSNLTNTAKGTVNVQRVCGKLYAAGIYGLGGAATNVTGCTNEAAITIEASNSSAAQFYLGGIVAFNNTESNFSFTSCINKGALKVNSPTTSAGFNYLSGIACSSSSKANISFDKCQSLGDIYMNCEAKWRIGGLAAFTGSSAKVTGNTVKANITAASKTKTFLNLGGLIGETATQQVFAGNTYTGTISATETGGEINVGGMVGSGTTGGTITYTGCTVEADITAASPTHSGLFNGRAANNAKFVFGTADSGCKVISGSMLNGAEVTELTDANLVGSAATYTVTNTNITIATK